MQLGESATMSGFYLSSPIIGSIVWALVWCVGPLMRWCTWALIALYTKVGIIIGGSASWNVEDHSVSPSPARAMFSFATNNTPCTVVVSVVVLLVCCACTCLRQTDSTPVVQKSRFFYRHSPQVGCWPVRWSGINHSYVEWWSYVLSSHWFATWLLSNFRDLFSQTRNSRFARKEFSDSRHFPEVLCVIIEVQCSLWLGMEGWGSIHGADGYMTICYSSI